MPVTGWLAGVLGRRRLLVLAVSGFTLTSLLCGMATGIGEMVMFRILQGVFGASLVPISQSLLLDVFPKEKHGAAMALWGVGIMIGPILGPPLGGWLTEYYSWRWVFLINLPIGILALLGILASVPKEATHTRGLDWTGFGLLALGIGGLQLCLDRGQGRTGLPRWKYRSKQPSRSLACTCTSRTGEAANIRCSTWACGATPISPSPAC